MSISFSGLASGLDTSSWIQSLTALKQAKVTVLQQEKETIQTSQDTLSAIKSFFAAFRSTIERITDTRFNIATMDLFAQNLAKSSDLKVLTATATTDAEEGTYEIRVDKLATNTKAVSRYNYMTTIVETTTATDESLLINLGVTAGTIGVRTPDGIERGIEITESDTIESFVQKLADVGVEAFYNSFSGVFSVNISASDINDIGGTGIVDALHLEGVNEGYTSSQLQIETVETIWSAAVGGTFLSELGVNAGTIEVEANGAVYNYTFDANTTLQQFIDALNADNITAGLTPEGIFSLEDAVITNDGTTNLIDAFGLNSEIYSNSQKSDELIYHTTILDTTTATLATKLAYLGDGINVTDGMDVIVENSSDETHTIAINANSTVGDLLTGLNNAGLSAKMRPDGTIEILGGTITGGSFDAISALGLNSDPYTAFVSGNALTETVEVFELVTLQTKLVDDLGVKEGYLSVTDSEGRQQYLKVYSGQTIGDLMTDLANFGIYSSLDEATGILTITGGDFATMSDTDVLAKIADGSIVETQDRYKQGTDLLTAIYGSASISATQTTVSQTYARSRALTYETLHTIDATLTTTLGQLGLAANETASFSVRGQVRNVAVTTDMTIEEFMDALEANGISSSFSEEHSKIRIENATITSSTADGKLGGVLGLTTEISGQYISSNALNVNNTVTINATRDTLMSELGITTNQSVLLYDDEGIDRTINITSTTTLGSLIDSINASGSVTATLEDGVLNLTGGYLANAAVEEALGLENSVKEYSYLLGLKMVVTTEFAHATTELKILGLGDSTITVKEDDGVVVGTITTNAEMTLGELLTAFAGYGISGTIENGIIRLDPDERNRWVEGGVAASLGITASGTEYTTTGGITQTSSGVISYTTNNIKADGDTKLSDLGYTSEQTLTINGLNGSAIGTVTIQASATLGDMLTALAGYGISGTIKDGVITLQSEDKHYVTGTFASALGIGNAQSGTSNITVAVTKSSTGQVSATVTHVADGSTKLSDLGYTSAQSITIKGLDGNTVGTVTLQKDATLNDMLTALAGYGISGTISGGVITLQSEVKNYVDGTFVTALGIGNAQAGTTNVTSGTSQTGSNKKYTTTIYTTTYPTTIQEIITTASVVTTNTETGTETFTVSHTYTDQYPVVTAGTITVVHSHTCTDVTVGKKTIVISDTFTVTEPVIGGTTRTVAFTYNYTTPNVQTRTHQVTGTTNFSTEISVETEVTVTHNWDTTSWKTWATSSIKTTSTSSIHTTNTSSIHTTNTSSIHTTNTSSIKTTDTTVTYTIPGSGGTISNSTKLGDLKDWGNPGYIVIELGKCEIGEIGCARRTTLTFTATDTIGDLTAATGIYLSGNMLVLPSVDDEDFIHCPNCGEGRLEPDVVDGNGVIEVELRLEGDEDTVTTSIKTTTTTVPYTVTTTIPYTVTTTIPYTVTTTIPYTHSETVDYTASELVTYTTYSTASKTVGTQIQVTTSIAYSTNVVVNEVVSYSTNTGTYYAEITIPNQASTAPRDITVSYTLVVDEVTTYTTTHYNTTEHEVEWVTTATVTDTYAFTFTVDTVTTTIVTNTVYATDYIETTTWKTESSTSTHDMIGATKFADLGGSGSMTVWSDGQSYSVSAESGDTVDDFISSLAGLGIHASISGGCITLIGDKNAYITSVSSGLATALGISSTASNYYSSSTHTWYSNDTSNAQSYNSTNIMTTDDTFAEMGMTSNGNITVFSDGISYTVAVETSDTIDDMISTLAGLGIVASVSGGSITFKGDTEAYITGISSGLATVLKVDSTGSNYNTFSTVTYYTNDTSNTQQYNTTNTMTTDDTFAEMGMTAAGNVVVVSDGIAHTVAVETSDTIDDFISTLAGLGIHASVSGGKITVEGDTEAYITSIDNSVATLLKLSSGLNNSYTTGTHTTYANSNSAVQQYGSVMTDDTTLAELGITSGNLVIHKDEDLFTVNIANTSTIADLRQILASYNINSEIFDGKLSLNADGVVYLSSASNLVTVLGLGYDDWKLGQFGQESKELTDTETITSEATLGKKLSELTNADGTDFGVTNGSIYVYKDGTRHLVNIDVNDTLQTLASKLGQYGITMGIGQDGKLYFQGENDSYMTTTGLSSGAASNILTKFNINGNWTPTYDSTSQKLDYEITEDSVINGSTKMTDLQDASGNSLGITEGEYTVVSNGVRTVETITADTTFDDFASTMAKYGMVAEITETGEISVGAQHNSYLLTSNTGYDTSAIATLFAEWNFTNVYTSNSIDIPEDVTVAISATTKLADINEGTYQEGFITVVKDGVQKHIELTADDTVETLMKELELYGFQAVVNDSGQLILKNTGNSILQNYVGPEQASNILDIMGVDLDNWINDNSYLGEAIDVNEYTTTTASATRDTLLSDLGITTGEYYIYKDGVKFTALISTDETLGSFLDTLARYGIKANTVEGPDSTILEITSPGNTYIAKSVSTTNSSNVSEILFPAGNSVTRYAYEGELQISSFATLHSNATEATLLRDLDIAWVDNANKANGGIAVVIDGMENVIDVTSNDTVGSLLNKFRALGLEASLTNGEIIIQSGYKEFEINTANTTSNAINDFGLTFVDDLGGFAASNADCEATTTVIEDRTHSVASWADENTRLGLLNITDGTITVFRNGQKASIEVHSDETFEKFRERVHTAFADVDVEFVNGYMKFSSGSGASVEVGSTTDTSNMAAICGFSNEKTGTVTSARELYQVNGSTKLTESGVFRMGDVTEGTFIIGNATFTIDNTTTLQDIMAQINASDEANTVATWDSIEGKLVLKSRATGSSFINIETGTSNFTDILCYTKTENFGGPDQVTKIDVANQEVGQNAVFAINDTTYTSTSNTITSDLSRITGVTINLKGVSEEGGTTTLTIEKDKETVANAVSDIVDAYNELIENVDKEIAKGGTLDDQFSLKLIRNQIRSLMTSSIPGATVFKNLDAIGISSNKAVAGNIDTSTVNVLHFDKNKFLSAFDSDLGALKNILVGTETNKGVFTRIEDIVENAIGGANGYFASAERSYNTQISRIDQKITKAQKAVEAYKLRLEAKFASMDLLIANYQKQYSSFLA